jgi:hypothetical protein
MTSVCYTPFKVPRIRVTNLDPNCGQPVTGCSTVVSDGIISIEMTKEYEDREEFFVKNGDGVFCVKETNPPILKWINLVITLCNVDPEMVNIMTDEPLVLDNAASPRATGFSTQEGTAATASFALEGWTRLTGLTGGAACTGGVEYGYVLFPWVVEGTVGDITFENGAVSFVVNARTRSNSLWGTGPYNVDLSDAAGNLNTPIPLLTPILSTQHHRMFVTRLAPPTSACGCTTLSSLIPG